MIASRFATLVRALTDGALTRRGFAQGLGAAVLAPGLALAGLEDAAARRRGGKKRRKKRNKRRGGNNGGDNDRCPFARCAGQCLDLDSDPANCGACGRACDEGAVCVVGFCAIALGSRGSTAD